MAKRKRETPDLDTIIAMMIRCMERMQRETGGAFAVHFTFQPGDLRTQMRVAQGKTVGQK